MPGGVVQSVLSSDLNSIEVVVFDEDNLSDREGLKFSDCVTAYQDATRGLNEVEFKCTTSEGDGAGNG